MSTPKKKPQDGGAAFPRVGFYPDTSGVHREDLSTVLEFRTEPQQGMSLRDWFAGQAIMGLMANSDLPDLFAKGFAPSKAAEIAYMVAEAMLTEREGGAR